MTKAKAVMNLDLQLSGDAMRGFLAYMEDSVYARGGAGTVAPL